MIEMIGNTPARIDPTIPSARAQTPISDGSEFGAMLRSFGTSVAASLSSAEQTSIAGIEGRAGAREVVEAIMKAEQMLQTSLALRDKTIAALQEISRMSI